MPESSFSVRRAVWAQDETAIAQVRRKVFIEEQAVPEDLEWETQDPHCAWFVACHESAVIGIARLTPAGRIGRMVILAPWRRHGVGSALLTAALGEARRLDLPGVHLSAQTHAVSFYARFGFRAEGDVYPDAGIPHIDMTLNFQERP
jgi:predicted GNAT family N-acyltransferase